MQKKTVIITGASKGIGRATALKLGREFNLALVARNADELNSLAREIGQTGGKALPVVCDITDEAQVEAAVQKTVTEFGGIDVLVNNAGIGSFKRVDQFTLDEFNRIYAVNVAGTFLFCKHTAPFMMQQKSGLIINISSVAGLNGFKTGTAYAASKFAVNGFTESLREDLKEYGIAVTVVCPGTVQTGFGDTDLAKLQSAEYVLEPEDVANTIHYLVNESETANAKLIELKPRRKREFR